MSGNEQGPFDTELSAPMSVLIAPENLRLLLTVHSSSALEKQFLKVPDPLSSSRSLAVSGLEFRSAAVPTIIAR